MKIANKALACPSFCSLLLAAALQPGLGFSAGGAVEAPAAAGPRAQPLALAQFPQAPEPMGGALTIFLGTDVGRKLVAVDPFYGELQSTLTSAPAKALQTLGPLVASGRSLRAGLNEMLADPKGIKGLSEEKKAELVERFLAAHVKAVQKVDEAVAKDVRRFQKETSVEAWTSLKDELEVLAPYSDYAWGQYLRAARVATELRELRSMRFADAMVKARGQLNAVAEATLASIDRTPEWSKSVAPTVVAAVFHNDAIKQSELGDLYAGGSGSEKDRWPYAEKAAAWYQEAARPRPYGWNDTQDFAKAQYTMGQAYEDGFGVPQDLVRAHQYYSLAAKADRYSYSTNALFSGAAQDKIDELVPRMERDELAKALTAGPMRHRTGLLPDESPSFLGSTFARIEDSFEGHRDYKMSAFFAAFVAGLGVLLGTTALLSPGQDPAAAWSVFEVFVAMFGGLSLFLAGLSYMSYRLRTGETRKLIRKAISGKAFSEPA
jgi:hypothetical protein